MERPVDRWLGQYASDHQNPTNRAIHTVCVPAILWTCIAAVWAIPLPGVGLPGVWAAALMLLVLAYYARLSPRLAGVMAAAFAALAAVSHGLYLAIGPGGTWAVAGIVFVAAWIAQFVGHGIEGKRPSFFTDLQYLLIGPLWVADKGLRRVGLRSA
ncbi:MAG: Mpo1-like protein [Myxococcota bacterium]